jgi:hypothetical protein
VGLYAIAGGILFMPLQNDPARYVAYTFFELLEDDYFRQWVRTPSLESDAFFTALRLWYPEKEKDITDACMLLRILSRPKVDVLSKAEAQALWQRIKRSIDQEVPSVSRS